MYQVDNNGLDTKYKKEFNAKVTILKWTIEKIELELTPGCLLILLD